MLHLVKIVKIANLLTKRTPLVSGLLFGVLLALMPISVQAQCKQWEVGGKWIIQQNNGFAVVMDLKQNGTNLNGTGYYSTITEAKKILGVVYGGLDPVTRSGSVTGNILGDDFYIEIQWDGGAGVYRGTVGSLGRIDGSTYDKNDPSSKASWFSDSAMKCAPPPPTPKPIKSSGKFKKDPPPPPKTPWILASQTVFPVPSQRTGFVVLTWDGGPDHPNAEVWVKTADGAQTAFKGSKDGQQITVERGRTYEYILTEGGKILSGVSFVAH